MKFNLQFAIIITLVMQGCSSYQSVQTVTSKRITGVIDSTSTHKSKYGNLWAYIGSKRVHFWTVPKVGDTVNVYVKPMF